ncbi:hypothetical protein [Planctobacterium marinum]|uniref:Uncharacterized protein n=1 Tax=Planctobacterium marinum TaxID=1631968 RepID=A0AA48KPI0_9ALTE|nr:hypothetical protein MACH26_21970 [Planctobacterium marinum]
MSERVTLKSITQEKKNQNWGEIPPFFHLVSNSIAEVEGMNVHGFDNAFKQIVKRSNWNLRRLGGEEQLSGKIVVERKPKLVIHRRFVGNNYEIHCMPEIDDEPVVLYTKNNVNIDFKVWDPSTMQCLIKLPDFIEFIRYAYTRGDDIDKKLVRYASLTIDNILKDLATEIDIIGLKGYSIKHIIERIEEEGSTA